MRKQLVVGVCALLLCAQFTGQNSTSAREKPAINVFGTLIDTSGSQTELHNITINGLVDRIPVYKMPPKNADDTYADPDSNKLLLDLRKVTRIASKSSHEKGLFPSVTIHSREYVPIVVVFNDNTMQDYIIEARRKILADDQTGGGSEREVSFKAVDRLVIKGDKPQDPAREEQQGPRFRENIPLASKVIDSMSFIKDTVTSKVNSFLGRIWYT